MGHGACAGPASSPARCVTPPPDYRRRHPPTHAQHHGHALHDAGRLLLLRRAQRAGVQPLRTGSAAVHALHLTHPPASMGAAPYQGGGRGPCGGVGCGRRAVQGSCLGPPTSGCLPPPFFPQLRRCGGAPRAHGGAGPAPTAALHARPRGRAGHGGQPERPPQVGCFLGGSRHMRRRWGEDAGRVPLCACWHSTSLLTQIHTAEMRRWQGAPL